MSSGPYYFGSYARVSAISAYTDNADLLNVLKLLANGIVFWLAWMGVVIGAFSAISAADHLFNIGLAEFAAEIVGFYRDLVRPVYDVARKYIPFSMSDTWLDVLTLYLVLLSMSVRAAVTPLLVPEVMERERNIDGKVLREIWSNMPKNGDEIPDHISTVSQNLDGTATAVYVKHLPIHVTWGRRIAYSMLLLPVLSLSPLRRLKMSGISAVDVVRTTPSSSLMTEINERHYVNTRYLIALKNYATNFVQILCLPLAVALFFALSKFGPF